MSYGCKVAIRDSDALSVLQFAQDAYFQTIPPKNNLIVEDVDSDGNSDSDSESETVSDKWANYSCGMLRFLLFENINQNIPPKLSAKSHLAWNMHYQGFTERQLLLCQEWTNGLRQFFGIEQYSIAGSG
ncbi:hypothetical protein L208DRAFT_1379595 [Tricholoma matsutake]|nr:hypothetical protein L208DRAFT_1379595 [Tricholoma matsutake 945]